MRLYALIGGTDTVQGVVQIESEGQLQALTSVYAQVIDITDSAPLAQIGWAFDGQNVVGTAASKKITKLAMRQRFTVSEMLALMSASDTVPIVKYLMKNLELATFVDLSRSDTQAGVALLVQLQLLTQERASVILNTPPSVIEVYTG